MVKNILIYDADCGICTYLANWILKKDYKNLIKIIPFQTFDFKNYNLSINIELAQKTLIFISPINNKYFIQSRAIFEILKSLNGIYKLIGIILSNKLCSLIFDPFYKIIAKNRAFISQKLGLTTCKITKY